MTMYLSPHWRLVRSTLEMGDSSRLALAPLGPWVASVLGANEQVCEIGLILEPSLK